MSVVGGDADLSHDMAKTYTAAPVYNHGQGGLAQFLTGLDLIDPGIVPARHWRTRCSCPATAGAGLGRGRPHTRPADAGAAMTSDMSELEALAFHWADAYLLSYVRGPVGGAAPRHSPVPHRRHPDRAGPRDPGRLPAPPGLRDCDPPGTADYLNLPKDGDVAGDGDVSDEESRFMLAALRYAFPAWTISYSALLRAWIARARGMTISQNSPVLLCAALLLIEHQQASGRNGPLPLTPRVPPGLWRTTSRTHPAAMRMAGNQPERSIIHDDRPHTGTKPSAATSGRATARP